MSGSRGRLILSMIESDIIQQENSLSRESSPAPSLTELTALSPSFVDNFLSDGSETEEFEVEVRTEDQFEENLFSEEHFEIGVRAVDQAPLAPAQGPAGYDLQLADDESVEPTYSSYVASVNDSPLSDTDDDLDDPTFSPEAASKNDSSSMHSFTAGPDIFLNEAENNAVTLVPYSDTDTEDDQNISMQNNKQGKKRVRNENTWKRNVRKKGRLCGKEYVNTKNVLTSKKSLKPPCHDKCRLKCNERITGDQRLKIHSDYWNAERSWDSKRQFVISCIRTKPVVRQRKREGTRTGKTKSHSFIFNLNYKEEVVCKTYFLNTLSISETFMRVALKKSSDVGLVTPDLRGKHISANKLSSERLERIRSHISKFPVYESHYSRERSKRKYLGNHLNISRMYSLYVDECKQENLMPEKMWVYSKVFNEDFNLSFHLPDNDTCDVCDKLDCELKYEKNDENLVGLTLQKENHLKDASHRYKLKREDKLEARATQGSRVIMSDLQKCLPTPDLKNSQSFYSRKLWTLNSTIYDTTVDRTWCMMWDETTAGRGGNEIASCLFVWAMEELRNPERSTEKLTVWTDNCSGQNRNINMVFMYLWLLEKLGTLAEVNHKFLLAGHTHMEVDVKHSVIERAKKKLKSHTIFTTNDWVNFIASCSKNDPFIVRRMCLEDFLDFLYLRSRDGPFVARKKNTEKEPFLISRVVWLQLRKGDSKLYYKTSFADETFKTVEFKRNLRGRVVMPAAIPKVRKTKKKISNEKYKDLMNLMQWVPEEYRAFFERLPHGETEGNFPEDDSTALE